MLLIPGAIVDNYIFRQILQRIYHTVRMPGFSRDVVSINGSGFFFDKSTNSDEWMAFEFVHQPGKS